MENKRHVKDQHLHQESTLRAYIIGFILSLLLTLASYYLVTEKLLNGWTLIHVLIGLSCIQAFIQLVCFLHLGLESQPSWNLLSFLFMLLVLVILVFGSLWIMHNLNERVMPTEHTEHSHA
ncbi:Cytochrome o ubiquinol oxidase protein CyoD [Candidatus Rubidus massiliensis]|nr:MAG: cytochrome o ubiquinol oxidase subunit IV [Chlamydia sp. 32-24]CDZ79620.1 Cytochrome o ubiquinol oxidase protein CyoD [Candidatus Rubidus massiliensis]